MRVINCSRWAIFHPLAGRKEGVVGETKRKVGGNSLYICACVYVRRGKSSAVHWIPFFLLFAALW